MFGLSAVPKEQEVKEIDLFKQEVNEGLQELLQACMPEITKARNASANIKRLQASIAEVEQKISSKEAEAERLREKTSAAAILGEDVSAMIHDRAGLIAEIAALKDLAADMRRQIPAAQDSEKMTARSTSNHIEGEIRKLRDSHQEEIEAKALELVTMIRAYRDTLSEFINESYPEFSMSGKQLPLLYIPDLHRIAQLVG